MNKCLICNLFAHKYGASKKGKLLKGFVKENVCGALSSDISYRIQYLFK